MYTAPSFKLTLLACSAISLLAITNVAMAGSFQIGSEFRDFNEPYKADSFQMHYVSFALNPVEGSPLSVNGKMDYRHMDLPATRSANNRTRSTLAIGYRWQFGQFTWSPKIGLRHQTAGSNGYSMEFRFYPGLRYSFNETTSLSFAGWLAPVKTSGRIRDQDADPDQRTSYTDYAHELELNLGHSLSPTQRVVLGLYHEAARKEYESRAFSSKRGDALQFRLSYRHRLNNLILEPYTRIDLTQNQTDGVGNERHQKRKRLGLRSEYKLTNQLSILPEIYYQVADVKTWNNDDAKDPEKNYMYYGLSFKYNFK